MTIEDATGQNAVQSAGSPVEADSQLLSRACAHEPAAVTELWNRYFLAAFRAACVTARDVRPLTVVSNGFQLWLGRAEKQALSAEAFLEGWFGEVMGHPLSAEAQTVTWAFYAMDEEARTIVWRSHIDGITPERLGRDLDLPEDSAEEIIAAADEQFREYAGIAAGLTGSEPLDMTTPDWQRTALVFGLLDINEANPELRFATDSRFVTNPPSPPDDTPLKAVTVPWRVRALSLVNRRLAFDRWWEHLAAPIRVASAGVAIAVVAGALALLVFQEALAGPPASGSGQPTTLDPPPASTPAWTPQTGPAGLPTASPVDGPGATAGALPSPAVTTAQPTTHTTSPASPTTTSPTTPRTTSPTTPRTTSPTTPRTTSPTTRAPSPTPTRTVSPTTLKPTTPNPTQTITIQPSQTITITPQPTEPVQPTVEPPAPSEEPTPPAEPTTEDPGELWA